MSRFVSFAALALVVAPLLLSPPAVRADEPEPYLDDRSTPASLLHSLYNAVDRKEYARAYGYFDASAVPDFDSFSAGYADTESVDLAIGLIAEEGAAGSTFWSVPVAIRAHRTNGTSKLFAGCYTLRLAQPTIQSPPFRPLHIVKAKLTPASGALEAAVPASCPG